MARNEDERRVDTDPEASVPRDENVEPEERISLADPEQVHRWAVKLGTSPEHLRELVAQVGPRVSDLQQRLSSPDLQTD